MNAEGHRKRLKESLDAISDAIEQGIDEKQRTIGFNASAACADMLEILLHKLNLIDPGFTVKHEWLKSKNKILEKFPFSFPGKEEIFSLIMLVEEKRDILCYGKPQKAEALKEVIENFNAVKKKFSEAGLDEP
ncbi:hypothetical protein HYU14_02720 [Candidatus Woesearchaeota archaeon]|nr:hypothetical protein [Candidatus Woesearchaeota archaeon]